LNRQQYPDITDTQIMNLNHRIGMLAAATALGLAAAGTANAAGCLKGAVVGGVAGHYAGHHAVVGAVGGCIVGHHVAKKQAEERATQHQEDRAHQLAT
jgi:outer membrane lipoprotein SlyB